MAYLGNFRWRKSDGEPLLMLHATVKTAAVTPTWALYIDSFLDQKWHFFCNNVLERVTLIPYSCSAFAACRLVASI